MIFTNKHPVFSLITAISLSIILAFIAALAGAMIHYYRLNHVDEFKVPEETEQMVVKRTANNINL